MKKYDVAPSEIIGTAMRNKNGLFEVSFSVGRDQRNLLFSNEIVARDVLRRLDKYKKLKTMIVEVREENEYKNTV